MNRYNFISKKLSIYNQIEIQGEIVYINADDEDIYNEYNDSLSLISSENSFWITDEIEYKIECPGGFVDSFENKKLGRFVFGKKNHQTTYERYYRLDSNNKTDYICILGKKNWKRPMAIKHKIITAGRILTRKVEIVPYSDEIFRNKVESLMEVPYNDVLITQMPVYYKSKDRVVCVDQDIGQVYGVSYSYSVPLSKKLEPLGELEIEYWSRIVKSGQSATVDYESFNILISLIKNIVGGKSPGRTKIEWLEEQSGILQQKIITMISTPMLVC